MFSAQAEESQATTGGNGLAVSALAHQAADAPVICFAEDLSAAGLQAIYAALGREASGENVAVKSSTGKTGSNYLRVKLIGNFVQGTFVENNTAYGGQRANIAMHHQLAADHGLHGHCACGHP